MTAFILPLRLILTDLDGGMHLIPSSTFCSIGDKVWMETDKDSIQDANKICKYHSLTKKEKKSS